MPLIIGKSESSFKKNLETEMDEGKPQKQSLAIAYALKKKAEMKAKGGLISKPIKETTEEDSEQMHEDMDGASAPLDDIEEHIKASIPDSIKELPAHAKPILDRILDKMKSLKEPPLEDIPEEHQQETNTPVQADSFAEGGEVGLDDIIKKIMFKRKNKYD